MPLIARYLLIFCFTCSLIASASAETRTPGTVQGGRAPASPSTEIVIAAVGDIMMPESVQTGVARNRHHYDLLFEKIAPDLTWPDITFANLETTIDHTRPIAGYPKFNARPELLFALKRAGVKIVSLANNHVLDAGSNGLKRTLDNVKKTKLRIVGAGKTRTKAEQPTIMTVRGVKVAFFAYTYITNVRSSTKPRNSPVVNMLRNRSDPELEKAVERIRKARHKTDLIVVSLHFGDEYQTSPTPWQRKAAESLIAAGADIILGHHPHVLQPIESFTAPNGRQGIIAYSLGNFISSQNAGVTSLNTTDVKALRGDAIVLTIYAKKQNGRTTIQRAEFLPIWTLAERSGNGILRRPVNIAKEISRIEGLQTRTVEEYDMLTLLSFRKKVITDLLTVRSVQ